MSFIPRKINPLVAGPLALLAWIIVVSAHFHFVLGAQVTREWIIAGVVVSLGLVCLILMLHEAADALATLSAASVRKQVVAARANRFGFPADTHGFDRIDSACPDRRRAALGLGTRGLRGNRPR